MGWKLVKYKNGVSPGPLSPKNACDLALYRHSDGYYYLVMRMKIQFIFHDNGKHTWGDAEKSKWIDKWFEVIDNVWGMKKICEYKGNPVYLYLRVKHWQGGWTISENWEIHVTKIKSGGSHQSSVHIGNRTSDLDSEDVNKAYKGHGQHQRGAVHEFGHMIGLKDEYHSSSAHTGDHASVMNRGKKIRDRHLNWLEEWINK